MSLLIRHVSSPHTSLVLIRLRWRHRTFAFAYFLLSEPFVILFYLFLFIFYFSLLLLLVSLYPFRVRFRLFFFWRFSPLRIFNTTCENCVLRLEILLFCYVCCLFCGGLHFNTFSSFSFLISLLFFRCSVFI